MSDEENKEPEAETPTPQAETDMAEQAKVIVDNAKDKVVDSIKNTMSILAPPKTRTIARMKQLTKASKWKHEKQIIHGQVEWKDTPPRELIGKLSMSISGGVGKITYVRFLKNTETGQAIKQANEDGGPPGGNILSHYVEETIAPAQKIKRESIVVKGCPSEKQALENFNKFREAERKRIRKIRGIE